MTIRFLFRRIHRFFSSFFFASTSTFSTNDETSLDLHPPAPSLRDISRGNGRFYPGYRSSLPVSQRFASRRIRCETVVQLDSHPPNLSTNIATDITTVHSPHDTSRHTIYRPALLNGQEVARRRREGRGGEWGLQPRLIKFWTRIALFDRISKRHGVNWKLVSLLIHGGVPWYRKKLPSTLLAPPPPCTLFFKRSRLERERIGSNVINLVTLDLFDLRSLRRDQNRISNYSEIVLFVLSILRSWREGVCFVLSFEDRLDLTRTNRSYLRLFCNCCEDWNRSIDHSFIHSFALLFNKEKHRCITSYYWSRLPRTGHHFI